MKPISGGWVSAAVLLAAATGCESLQPRSVQIDAASGRYQSAQLTYELDTGRLSQPVQTARIAAQQVSYQQQPSNPLPDRSHARLSVQYPHPRGKGGFALAEVVIEADQAPVKSSSGTDKSALQRFAASISDAMNDILPGMQYAEGVREAWALDVSKEELDQLIGQLANSGYFAYGPDTTPGVEVFTRLDGRVIRKTWHQVPALNDFIERVRHEGQLVSYVRPAHTDAQPADAAGGRNDSVAAYEQQQQRLQQQSGPPPQPFPTNLELAAQQRQPGPQAFSGPAAGQQPPPYMSQRPAGAMPAAGAVPPQHYGGPTQSYGSPGLPPANAAPQQYGNGGSAYNPAAQQYAPGPQYAPGGSPYNNVNSPQYQGATAPQYNNQYNNTAPPGYAPQNGSPSGYPAPGQYPSPGVNAQPGNVPQAYPPTSQSPGYPPAANPPSNPGQGQPPARSYPGAPVGYFPRS